MNDSDGNAGRQLPLPDRGRDPPTLVGITAYRADDFLIPTPPTLFGLDEFGGAPADVCGHALAQEQTRATGFRSTQDLQPHHPALQSQASVVADPTRLNSPPSSGRPVNDCAELEMDRSDPAGSGHRAQRKRALPRLIMLRTVAGISRQAAANTILHAPRPNANSRGVVRPSPDMLYSICVYDLNAAGGAIRVSTHDMPDTYWSVSLFDVDTNNFYALNDRQTKAGAADFVLTASGAPAGNAGLPVVVPPTAASCCFARSSTTTAASPRSTPNDGLLPAGPTPPQANNCAGRAGVLNSRLTLPLKFEFGPAGFSSLLH